MALTPTDFTAAHLFRAALPDDAPDRVVDAKVHYQRSIERVDDAIKVSELWAGRFRVEPEPEQPQTLQELVQAARRRLRNDRVTLDTNELQIRRDLLQHIRTGLDT